MKRKGQRTKVPGSELAMVLLADSLQGAKWLGVKRPVLGYPQLTENVVQLMVPRFTPATKNLADAHEISQIRSAFYH